jgi:hypothetical protein
MMRAKPTIVALSYGLPPPPEVEEWKESAEAKKLILMEGACPWQYARAKDEEGGEDTKEYIGIIPCSSKSVTLADFLLEPNAFGRPPDRATKESVYHIKPLDMMEIERSSQAAYVMRTTPHGFWGVTWLEARALAIVAQHRHGKILAKQVAHQIVDEFALDDDEDYQSILDDCVLALTQVRRKMPWLKVNERGQLSLTKLATSGFADEDQDLVEYLLPWLMFGEENLGPDVPTLLVDGTFTHMFDSASLKRYLRGRIDQTGEPFPNPMHPPILRRDDRTRLLEFPINMPISTRELILSGEDGELLPGVETAGFNKVRCTIPAYTMIQRAMDALDQAPKLIQVLQDNGQLLSFPTPALYMDWWYERKLDRIVLVHGHIREGTGLIPNAKLFVSQLFADVKVEETYPPEVSGSGTTEVFEKRFFQDDDTYAEKLASIRFYYPQYAQYAEVFANMPVSKLSHLNLVPTEGVEHSMSARELYLVRLM